jgi:hypothetical protein
LDHENSTRLKARLENEPKEALADYVAAMRMIDLRDCPADFQEAFLSNRQAWNEFAKMADKYDGVSGLLRAWFNDVGKEERDIRRGISETWKQVELTAMKHGAKTAR